METAYILVKCSYRKTLETIEYIKNNIDQVKDIECVLGEKDIIFKVEIEKLDDIAEIILEKLWDIGCIESTETHLVIKKEDYNHLISNDRT